MKRDKEWKKRRGGRERLASCCLKKAKEYDKRFEKKVNVLVLYLEYQTTPTPQCFINP